MTTKQKTSQYKPCQLPYILYERIEKKVKEIRMETGSDIRYMDYLKILIELGLSSDKIIDECKKILTKQ